MRLGRGSNKSLQASKQQNPRSKIDVIDRQTDGQTDQPKDQHSVLQSRLHATKNNRLELIIELRNDNH